MKRLFLCLSFLLIALVSASCVCAVSDVNAQDAIVDEIDDSVVGDSQDIAVEESAVEETDDNETVAEEIDEDIEDFHPAKDTLASDDTVSNLVDLYGSNTKEELASKLGISEDEVCKMIADLKNGKYGKDYKKIMLGKEEHLRDEMDMTNSYIVTDFNTTEESYINPYIEDYHPQGVTKELVEYVISSYGHASVSLMAFRYGVSCGEIIDAIHEIKLGKHGESMKNRFLEIDDKNLKKVNELAAYIIC